jgi:hypothetical protein
LNMKGVATMAMAQTSDQMTLEVGVMRATVARCFNAEGT